MTPTEKYQAKVREFGAKLAAMRPRPLTFRKLRAERAALLVVAAEPVPHLGNWHLAAQNDALPHKCYQCAMPMLAGSGELHVPGVGICGRCREHGAPFPLPIERAGDVPMVEMDEGPRAA